MTKQQKEEQAVTGMLGEYFSPEEIKDNAFNAVLSIVRNESNDIAQHVQDQIFQQRIIYDAASELTRKEVQHV